MTLSPPSTVRDPTSYPEDQKLAIRHFLQGAVYCWCKNRPEERFSLRDLMGGANFFWEGTPLIVLYENHERLGGNAIKRAAQDAGWLLKRVLDDDKRDFAHTKEEMTTKYLWKQG